LYETNATRVYLVRPEATDEPAHARRSLLVDQLRAASRGGPVAVVLDLGASATVDASTAAFWMGLLEDREADVAVIAVVTAITSFIYPILFRSSDGVSGFLRRWSPRVVRTYVESLGEWLGAMQRSFQFNSPSTREIQRTGRGRLVQ